MNRSIVIVAIVALSWLSPFAAESQVSINVNVGPPPVLVAPPQLVIVPDSPVFYAPQAEINVFSYGGRFYSLHDGHWFWARTYRGPWVLLPPSRVPPPVLAVPPRYYRIPPGQARKMEEEREGRGHGRPHGCPPGLARQGRC